MSIEENQQEIIEEFSDFDDWMDKYQLLIDMGSQQEPLPQQYKTESNLIDGCQSRVWLQADLTPEGTITCSFDGSPSVSMFTAANNYGDGKITYKGTYYKKGEKMDSRGSITFTPTKDYNMTLVLATAKSGRDIKVNGTVTTVSGTTNTEGAYYELQPIAITAGTEYTLTKGNAESIVMLVILEPR